MEALRGVNTFLWDLLLDEELALAAESERLAEKADDKADKKKKKKQQDESAGSGPEKGARAKTPWAERVRLGRPLYVTPGKYKLVVRAGDNESETSFEIDKPRPRTPRAKPEPKIRGEKKKKKGGD